MSARPWRTSLKSILSCSMVEALYLESQLNFKKQNFCFSMDLFAFLPFEDKYIHKVCRSFPQGRNCNLLMCFATSICGRCSVFRENRDQLGFKRFSRLHRGEKYLAGKSQPEELWTLTSSFQLFLSCYTALKKSPCPLSALLPSFVK